MTALLVCYASLTLTLIIGGGPDHMILVRRNWVFIWLSLVFLIGQWGCATAPKPPPPLLSEQVRANLGTIGVATARFSPEAHLEAPTSGKWSGAGKGAAAGFFGSIQGAAQGGGYGGAVVLLLSPVFAMGGAIYGAIAAESAEKVEAAEATFKKALADLKIQETFRDRVLQVARDQTRHVLVLVPEHGPTAPGGAVEYSFVASQGVDTVLEIGVEKLGLPGGGINPPLSLIMNAHARLVRATDGMELHARTWIYRSGTRKFVEWAADNAQPLHEELERAYQSLAEQVVDELFLLYLVPPISSVGEGQGAIPLPAATSGEEPPRQKEAEPSTATEAKVEPTAATSKSEQPPSRSKPEQAPAALEKVEPAPVPSPALGAFANIAGTWLGRFEFGATRRSAVGDWPLTLNIKEDGSYEAFGATRSSGKARIVDGKFVFQLDTGSRVETFTLRLREHGGRRFLSGPNQDGSLSLQLGQ